MKTQVYYTYMGTNGTITSPVHLEDVYFIRKLHLEADNGKVLTKDDKVYVSAITIPEEDLELWKEVKATKKTGQK